MTDCLSCKHAEPARAPDGSIDFRIKNCKRFPPTPIVLMGPQGQPMMSSAFPTVGAGVLCAEHAVREAAGCCKLYSPVLSVENGPCQICGFPKMAHNHSPERMKSAIEVDLGDAVPKIKELIEAVEGLGAMPEGYCYCAKDRVGDDSKIHEPECRDLRAALARIKK